MGKWISGCVDDTRRHWKTTEHRLAKNVEKNLEEPVFL